MSSTPPTPPANPGAPLNWFDNCALAMSTICILAGGITSFHVGFCSVGGAGIGVGWPLGCLFALTVGLTMGQAASAYPRSGGPSLWAARMGNPGSGWAAGCFNLAGLVTAAAAVNMGLSDFIIRAMGRQLAYDPQKLNPWVSPIGAALITLSQAAIACLGMRRMSWIFNASGYLIAGVAVALTGCMIALPLANGASLDFSRLVTFTNYGGEAGGKVMPSSESLAWLFLLGLLLPAYTVTGFDSSAHTADETTDPARSVPNAIVWAVVISGVFGWVMLSSVILAAPDLNVAASKGEVSFFWIVREVIGPQWVRTTLYVGIDLAQYVCGLATLTAASRLVWAMARDRGLPGSPALHQPQTLAGGQTPYRAIWAACGVALVFVLFVPYMAIASACATFLYIAYVIPTAWGLVRFPAELRSAKWKLWRGWYRPLAAICVLGCGGLIVISVQPPNAIARPIVEGTVVALILLWNFWMCHEYQPGTSNPPPSLPGPNNPPPSPANQQP